MGQKPITFIRQVMAACLNRDHLNPENCPSDVIERANGIVDCLFGQSIGVYSGEWGMPLVRKHIAKYIEDRDEGVPSNSDHICLSTGASGAIINVLSMFANEVGGKQVGVLAPIPQYPLYSFTTASLGMQFVPYYLKEEHNWSLDVHDLENVVNHARSNCQPKILVVINPGNPTGQVLTRQCIEEVIKFAHREHLYIFADEVYQQNVFQKEVPFQSFKKVMVEMGPPYSNMELASFMSVSKGYAGECGIRGGYVELFNPNLEILPVLNKILQSQLCPSVMGQVAVDCVVNEPVKGDASYEQFIKEKNLVLETQKLRSQLVSSALNSFTNVSCCSVMGAMYAFPRLHLPDRAIAEARSRKLEPDSFYALELLNATGICTSPGSIYGQKPGTYHLRLTILGDDNERLTECMKSFETFNNAFMDKYK